MSFVVLAQTLKRWDDPANNCMIRVGDVDVPTLKCLEVLFSNFLLISSALFIFGLFLMFIIGSYTWLTSFGNPEKVKKAQGIFRYAIIGLIVFISSYLILKTIDFLFLGNAGKIFEFSIGEDLAP